ncbi:MAG: M48 family metallopeptidase [Pseudomonadales bacterium]|nr:M48 family metallopeptidase [Pseudomonadales bacterium]MBL4868511.1 M48 family metallopeptidase [Pseudomonadales bacterium]
MSLLTPTDKVVEPSNQLSYRVIRSSRKTLAVYVYPSGEIVVRSPKQCSDFEIRRHVQSRERWITKTLTAFLEMPGQLNLSYETGEAHAYLGELYPLLLATGKTRQAAIKEDKFQVCVRPGDETAHIKTTLVNWYRQQATAVFSRRLDFCYKAFSHVDVKKPKLKCRLMKARWGSCSSEGDVTLNLELIKHPIHVIDYVITHELCHLIEFNHSARFYELMVQAIPTWKQSKADLEKGVFLYGSF